MRGIRYARVSVSGSESERRAQRSASPKPPSPPAATTRAIADQKVGTIADTLAPEVFPAAEAPPEPVEGAPAPPSPPVVIMGLPEFAAAVDARDEATVVVIVGRGAPE